MVGRGQSREAQYTLPRVHPSRWVASSSWHPSAQCHQVQGFVGHNRDSLKCLQLMRDTGRLVE